MRIKFKNFQKEIKSREKPKSEDRLKTLNDVKQEFVNQLDEFGRENLLNKNFLGTLTAAIMEGRAVTQDEIMKITGYGRSTVSQTLGLLQQDGFVREIRKRGSRKKYFEAVIRIQDVLFLLVSKKFEAIRKNLLFVKPFIQRLEALECDHIEVEFFLNFLYAVQSLLQIFVELIVEQYEAYPKIIKNNISNLDDIRRMKDLASKELSISDFDEHLLDSNGTQYKNAEKRNPKRTELDEIKKDFLFEIEQLLIQSRKSYESALIIYVVFFDYYAVNQDRLMEMTGYARSTISETLSQLKAINFIQEYKIKGDRHNYYRVSAPFKSIMTQRIDAIDAYLHAGKRIIQKAQEDLKDSSGNIKDGLKLIQFLTDVEEAFDLYDEFIHSIGDAYNKKIAEITSD